MEASRRSRTRLARSSPGWRGREPWCESDTRKLSEALRLGPAQRRIRGVPHGASGVQAGVRKPWLLRSRASSSAATCPGISGASRRGRHPWGEYRRGTPCPFWLVRAVRGVRIAEAHAQAMAAGPGVAGHPGAMVPGQSAFKDPGRAPSSQPPPPAWRRRGRRAGAAGSCRRCRLDQGGKHATVAAPSNPIPCPLSGYRPVRCLGRIR